MCVVGVQVMWGPRNEVIVILGVFREHTLEDGVPDFGRNPSIVQERVELWMDGEI